VRLFSNELIWTENIILECPADFYTTYKDSDTDTDSDTGFKNQNTYFGRETATDTDTDTENNLLRQDPSSAGHGN